MAEVRIRVYPDKIHLDAHDPDLTVDEVAAGQRYWQLQWQAGVSDGGSASSRPTLYIVVADWSKGPEMFSGPPTGKILAVDVPVAGVYQ